ncbi:MBL fold metallo-hydrolase [Desulfovibrio sp. Fe33]|uniref:MBL fold metallo-hydrolase n=1 Tax=Desulfovibrio sp. Fe33 TaxID=3020842 RepID=UPI00234CEEB8|nr:MBL fold metallo-hydrolase [Desulfovibrio sp. Fe33]
MQCEIIYIHHNAFVMRTDRRTFLFDYPEDEHLPEGAGDLVRRIVSGADLAVFISHGHGDHCNGNLGSVTGAAARVRYVISDDVGELRPEALPGNGETLLIEPDEARVFDGMAVETLMSNDLGVAFLVEDGGFRFYYGGDLAEWIWPGASSREAAFTERFFREAMERARDFRPHVAFADVDPRLDNLAGGLKARRIINASVFVPMHAFGDVSAFSVLAGDAESGGSRLFSYSGMGDSMQFYF